MLVLSRKKGESVVVNGNITIVVVDVRGDKARIGIEAPADVAVYRSEVLAKSAAANAGNEAAKDGEIAAPKTSRKTTNVGETQRRGKAGSGRGAKKKTGATADENGENAVETLCLSSEAESYRRSDAAEETAASSERGATNAALETLKSGNNAK